MNKSKVDAFSREDCVTISDLYRWAVKNGVESLPLVTWEEWRSDNDYTQIKTADVEIDNLLGDVVCLYL